MSDFFFLQSSRCSTLRLTSPSLPRHHLPRLWFSCHHFSSDKLPLPLRSRRFSSVVGPRPVPETFSYDMARPGLSLRRRKFEFLQFIILMIHVVILVYLIKYSMRKTICNSSKLLVDKRLKRKLRLVNLHRLIRDSDVLCQNHLRMNRDAFNGLCEMVRGVGGLEETKHMSIEEIVAMFLYIIAHHKKNRCVSAYFYRSGETVSRQFQLCLKAILKLHNILLKKPDPITEDCDDNRWKYFKNCLGALDGTMINVTVPAQDRSKYRTRKGTIAMNVLGVCSTEMEFIYVLSGWEGSAHDGRVLRDAISRPNGLKVPKGCYYLCDAGYTNGDGFLAPYRGHIYHLREWNSGPRQPRSADEYFNLRHAMARNVIERCFGVLKGRWGILRSPSWFSLKTHSRIVMACCLLHNLIKKYKSLDPLDNDISYDDDSDNDGDDNDADDEVEYIASIGTSDPWTNYRDSLAQAMFNDSRAGIHQD